LSPDGTPSPAAVSATKSVYVVSSFVEVVGMSPADFNGDPARIKSFAQALSALLSVAPDHIFNVRACAAGTAEVACPRSSSKAGGGNRRRTRVGTRRLNGEESVVFYDIVYASSLDASTAGASIERLDSTEFTNKFTEEMNTNGVDSSITSKITTNPSKQSTATKSKTGDSDNNSDNNSDDNSDDNSDNNSDNNSDEVTGNRDDTGGGSDGDNQQSTTTGDASGDSNMTGVIVGVVVGVLAVAILAVVIIVVMRRNKRQRTAGMTRLSEVGIDLQMNPLEKKQQVSEDSPIPCDVPGWEMHMDNTSGQAYYHNPMSGETSWEKPLVEGNDDWIAHVDPGTKQTYYHSNKRSRTTWTEHLQKE